MGNRGAQLSERYRRADVEVGFWGGTPVPLRFGDGAGEYAAIRERAGLSDYSGQGKLRITGRDSKDFLQRMLTRDIEYLDAGRSRMTLLLDDEGHIVGDGTLYCLDDGAYLLEAWGAQRERIATWLARHTTGFEVEVSDVTADLAILAVEGPDAWRVMQKLVSFDIMGLRYQWFQLAARGDSDVLVARTGYTAEYGYKLFAPASRATELWQQLVAEGQAFGIQPSGIEAVETCMLEVRFPCLTRETGPETTPLEAALNWMVDFRKEEFVGKKALMDRWARGVRERLVCFTTDGDPAVETGTAITVEHEPVGVVARTEWSPGLNRRIGIAYLDDSFAAAGLDFTLETPGGARPQIRTVSAPFVIPRSWTVPDGPR